MRCWTSARRVKTAPPPQCDKGWLEVSRDRAKALVKQGWEIKQVGSILCARRRRQTEVPSTAPTPSQTPMLKIDPKLLKKLPGVQ